MDIPERVARRAHDAYTVDENGCHVSTYSTGSHGYAQIGWHAAARRVATTAHRAAWVHAHGQIRSGMTIDHLCKNRRCVNVAHLRELSNYENARRSAGDDWPLGQCRNGHPDTELRDYPSRKNRSGTLRQCRLCRRDYQTRYEAKRK